MTDSTQDDFWADAEIISAYTRNQALEDGFLVDCSEVAKEAGFSIPAAMTRAVWGAYVEVPDGVVLQDEAGRLWDILWMARAEAVRPRSANRSRIEFQLHVRNDNDSGMPPLITLAAVVGPSDNGLPCLTIMLPEED